MKVNASGHSGNYRTVTFDSVRNEVLLIEQRLLPHTFEIARTRDFHETARAIKDMVVRGAGAIGATAAYGFAQGLRAFDGPSEKFEAQTEEIYSTIKQARPTAIDPVNALDRMRAAIRRANTLAEKKEIALREAEAFAEEDVQHCREIGEHGLHLIPKAPVC